MKLIKLIILTAIMISLSGATALGQGYQSYPGDGSQMSESAFYTNNMPSNYETLVQVESYTSYSQYSGYGQVMPENALWISDPSGMYRRTSLSIPLSYWAREDVLPGVSGYMTMYERYPSGIVHSLDLGYVYAGYRYMVWFRADLRGTHDVWYTVNGLESNHITFDVYRANLQTRTPQYVAPYYYTDYYYPRYYYTEPYPKPRPRPTPSPYSYVGTSTGART